MPPICRGKRCFGAWQHGHDRRVRCQGRKQGARNIGRRCIGLDRRALSAMLGTHEVLGMPHRHVIHASRLRRGRDRGHVGHGNNASTSRKSNLLAQPQQHQHAPQYVVAMDASPVGHASHELKTIVGWGAHT